jgi:hypothetical protein
MAARGETDAAAEQFRDMLPHLRRRLGADHPDTRAAAAWLDARQAGRPAVRTAAAGRRLARPGTGA